MSGKLAARVKGPPTSAGDAASPRKKVASLKSEAKPQDASSYEELLQEKNFIMGLLQQAKTEREQFIETLKDKDLQLKEKDTRLSKLAHRTMAEEQAFRETLAEARLQFDTKLIQRDNKIRQREMLICDLVEIVTTAELYSSKSTAISDVILRAVQTVPVAKYTVESVCRNQTSDSDRFEDDSISSPSGVKALRQHKVNKLLEIINGSSAKSRPESQQSTKKKKRSKSPKKKKPVKVEETRANSEKAFSLVDSSESEDELAQTSILYSASESDADSTIPPRPEPLPPQAVDEMGMSSYLAGVEESNYSLAVGEEKSSVIASGGPSVGKVSGSKSVANEISLGSYTTESAMASSMVSSEAGMSVVRVAPSERTPVVKDAGSPLGSHSNSASLVVGDHPHPYSHIQDQGSYFTLSSESGSLTESRKKSKAAGGGLNTDTANLPYWWSSLAKT